MRLRSIKNNKGFSLIELIIIVAIIALLVGIIVPNFLGYIDKARKARDLEMARVLGTALQRVLAIDDKACKQWDNIKDQDIYFDVKDHTTGASYRVVNVFEWTLTKEGDIAAGAYENNFRNGKLRDARGAYNPQTDLYNAYLAELAQYDINIFYRKYKIKQYRVLKRRDNGNPEVWVCAVKDGTDGEGRNGFLYYRLWPDPDPEYMVNKKPVVAANANNAGRVLE
jgi:prepilin-type N-terminal cleavage/methylation domain-containing protein